VKNKKLKGCFGFWVFVALDSFWPRNEKPNQENSKYKVRQLRSYEISREQIEESCGMRKELPGNAYSSQ